MLKSLFVSGTDTEVGKTWISCRILEELSKQGQRAGAWKPVCSGAVERDGRLVWEDAECLIRAIGGDETDDVLLERVCPQRFTAALAPNIAARLEGNRVLDEVLQDGLMHWQGKADYVLVEGAGGLLSPTSDRMLVADLAVRLQAPVLLVAANRLGVIHQTLATVEAAEARGLGVVGVVLNQVEDSLDSTLRDTNLSELQRLLPETTILVVDNDGAFDNRSHGVQFTDWFA